MIDIVKEAAEEVYSILGPGHSEAVYQSAMDVELLLRSNIPHRREVPCVMEYKGRVVGTGFIDILMGDCTLVIEIKAITKLGIKDEQQVRKYLTATGIDQGLLINFGQDFEIIEVKKGDYE